MVVRKRKKVTKYRGSKTHGGGSKKKRRGAGNRGGRGMAGTGKRADQKKPSIWHLDYFGKKGFKAKNVKKLKVLTLNDVSKLIDQNKLKKENDFYVLDLKAVGYDKLIGSGYLTKKIKVINGIVTEKAKTKIKALGGIV